MRVQKIKLRWKTFVDMVPGNCLFEARHWSFKIVIEKRQGIYLPRIEGENFILSMDGPGRPVFETRRKASAWCYEMLYNVQGVLDA